MTADRPYDLVLFGATGFTGGLTAEYLAEHAPERTRWAVAGRSQAKLEALRDRLTALNPACKDLPLLHADVTDPASIRTIATSTRVVVSTVGPYISYGEPLVAACAAAGTDYLDLTGEAEFVDLMYVRYHEQAQATGARLVHSCGFDSIPYDLGAYFTVQQLPEDLPIRIEGFLRASGTASGGTVHTMITAMSRARQSAQAALARRRVEPVPDGRRVRIARGMSHFAPSSGARTLPMPTIDPLVVARSARALDRYGPDFCYAQFVAVRHLASAIGVLLGAGTVFALAQLPPTRNMLLRVKSPGDGPSADKRAKSWFSVRFVGEGVGEGVGGGAGEAIGRRVVTEVAGGDPGYGDTAKMLAESALCLAHDDLPETSGQVTTAVAMGNPLIDRLRRAGITFRVLKAA